MSKFGTNRIVGLRPTFELGTNPKDAFGLLKVPLSLIPRTAKILIAMGLAVGAIKYGEYNWRVAKVRIRLYLEAAERHLDALMDGEDLDPETGVPHIAFLMATSAIVADGMYGSTRGMIDDRPLPSNSPALTRKLNKFFTPEYKEALLAGNHEYCLAKGRIFADALFNPQGNTARNDANVRSRSKRVAKGRRRTRLAKRRSAR